MTGNIARTPFISDNPALSGFMQMTDTLRNQDRGDQELAIGGLRLKGLQREDTQATDADAELAKSVLDQISKASPDDPVTPARQTAAALAAKGQGRKAAETLDKDEKDRNAKYLAVLEQYGTRGNAQVGDLLAQKLNIKIPDALKANKVFTDGIVYATKLDTDHGDPEWVTKFAVEYAKNGGNPEAAMSAVGAPKPKKAAPKGFDFGTVTDIDGKPRMVAGNKDTGEVTDPGVSGSFSRTGAPKPGAEKKFVTQNDSGDWVYGWRKADGTTNITTDKAPPPPGTNKGSAPLKTQNDAGEWVWGKFDRSKGEIVPTDSPAPPPSNSADAAKAKGDAQLARSAKAATDKELISRGKQPSKVSDDEYNALFQTNLRRSQAGTPPPTGPRGGAPQAKTPDAAVLPAPLNPADRVKGQRYSSPSGKIAEWTGTGWKLVE